MKLRCFLAVGLSIQFSRVPCNHPDLQITVLGETFVGNASFLADLADKASQLNLLRNGLTYWYTPNSKPRCLIEQMVAAVVALDARAGVTLETLAGVEYWTHEGTHQALHYDFDEYYYERPPPGPWPTPRYSSVTYLALGVDGAHKGAPTLVLSQRQHASGEGDDPSVPQRAALVFPRVNKHIRFDGGLSHGILGRDGDNEEMPELGRVTLLVNYWDDRPRGWDGGLAPLPDDLVDIFPIDQASFAEHSDMEPPHIEHLETALDQHLQEVVYHRYELPTTVGGDHVEVAWRARMPLFGEGPCAKQCQFIFDPPPERVGPVNHAPEL